MSARYSSPPCADRLLASTAKLKSALDRLEANPPVSMRLASTLVYVAGKFTAPDRAGVEANIHAAALVGLEVAKLGACPIVPHSNTALPEYEAAQPYKFWILATLEMLRRCDALITVPGWELSSGARGEVTAANEMRKPVFHSVAHLADWLALRRLSAGEG